MNICQNSANKKDLSWLYFNSDHFKGLIEASSKRPTLLYIPGFSQTWKTWKTLKKAYILDNSGKTWNMSLENKFFRKTIMVEGKTREIIIFWLYFPIVLCFLICSKIIQFRKFVCDYRNWQYIVAFCSSYFVY